MPRILIALMLMVVFVCGGLGSIDARSGSAQGLPNHVMVTFSGLMIFSTFGRRYEVGILPDAARHKFDVLQDGDPKTPSIQTDNDIWTLAVTGESNTAEPHERGHVGRLRDTPIGQYDLSWWVNLDDLHPEMGIKIKARTLNPKIRLLNGKLFTSTKTEYMNRIKNQVREEFGFLTEAVGLSVYVLPGQSFSILSGNHGTIIHIPYDERTPFHRVTIQNIRQPQDHSSRSDFDLYYGAITDSRGNDIPPPNRYDFELFDQDTNGHRDSPFNPAPRHLVMIENQQAGKGRRNAKGQAKQMTTCCGYECNPTGTSAQIP